MTGLDVPRHKLLKIGDISVANRVLLAPMSGITDAPFRRLAASLGAGLVVSEMTASDDLVHGRAMSVLRCEARGAAIACWMSVSLRSWMSGWPDPSLVEVAFLVHMPA